MSPIETILSGPAASIVGAQWMTGAQKALVSDIGGTTTDVALLRGGKPKIDPAGARVGPYRTMVEAVAMRTHGLGGDSEVHFVSEGLQGGVTLGPRRVIPVSLIAKEAPDVVHGALDAQLRSALPSEHDGRFVRMVKGLRVDGLGPREAVLLDSIGEGVLPMGQALKNRIEAQALKRLVERGLVQIAALTPSDASHALGRVTVWDRDAASKALALMGRRRTGAGEMLSSDPLEMAQLVIGQLTHQTALALLETGFAEESESFGLPSADLARHVLTQRGLGNHRGLLRLDVGLNLPVIGLGASARSYYPAVGERLGCETILPEHGGVANAIGAVVGQVAMHASGTVTSPGPGAFAVHLPDGLTQFSSSDEAMNTLETALRNEAGDTARAAGVEEIRFTVDRDIKQVEVEDQPMFIEATIKVTAQGRPRIATT